jgi:hypothetical protein
MIYRRTPSVSLKGGLGANKLFENSSYFGLKLMFVQPAIIILCDACCVTRFNFLNFAQNFNFKFLFSYSSVYKHPFRDGGKFPFWGQGHEF